MLILLLVTVAVSVIIMYDENYHAFKHQRGAWSDTDCIGETNGA